MTGYVLLMEGRNFGFRYNFTIFKFFRSIILWYPRPFNSVLSPASLILIDESLETVDNELSVLRREDELAQQRLQKERQAEKEKIEAEQAKEGAVEVTAVRLREV